MQGREDREGTGKGGGRVYPSPRRRRILKERLLSFIDGSGKQQESKEEIASKR